MEKAAGSTTMQLTPAQEAVVAHDEGPALVFAVAGAGKTTAMVHRIERLVREGVFPAERILATSFGRANEEDLKRQLAPWPHCAPVRVHTLHAVGRGLIALAQRYGYLPHLKLDAHKDVNSRRLLWAAASVARRRSLPYAPELDGMDEHDFLDYVGACKGNLQYAHLEAAGLPDEALAVARQAAAPAPPLDWYLDFYRLFEELRQKRGLVTFDDMLLTGWETLASFAEVREAAQARYQCVLVDEYQDINCAQSEILDLLTAGQGARRNYMAIGDDDQTIYEWRGASPHYILDFTKRYRAERYFIEKNFRCPVGPLLLANRVIAHNQQRESKRLQLTRGLAGEISLERHRNQGEMARRIVHRIQQWQAGGRPLHEAAILVRLNAQTPPIEQALIQAGLPYRVSLPFYKRAEISLMIDYVRLAWVERALQEGEALSAGLLEWFADAWRNAYNRPLRYLSRTLHDAVLARVRRGRPPTFALQEVAPQAPHEGIMEEMEALADTLAWLALQLDEEAGATLARLEAKLGLKQYWREHSGFPQTGEGRAASVAAFVEYARGQGSTLAFMAHVRQLAEEKIGRREQEAEDAVILSTIHGAKGLEWPLVFIAGCNQETMPFLAGPAPNLEEERRLFYVALTRSRRHLSLHALAGEPLSQFLGEAGWRQVAPAVQRLQQLEEGAPETWQAADALALAQAVEQYQLADFFRDWWQAPRKRQQAVGRRMHHFFAAADAAGALEALDLRPEQAALWQRLAGKRLATPVPAFPGLAALLQAGPEASLRAPASNGAGAELAAAAAPVVVRPGMWLWCDAGWGRVEAIHGPNGQPQTQMPAEGGDYRLQVTLRPGQDRLAAELSLREGRIRFPGTEKLYTCTRCHLFSAADPNLISGPHNDAAHGGAGARYQRERSGGRSLRNLVYQEREPEEPLA